MKRIWITLMATLLLASCGGGGDEGVRVFAAASMTDAVTRLADEFEGATGTGVTTGFGPSSTLARQIEDGAPADVYISANRDWVEYLKERGRLKEDPVVIARNRLVCIVAADSELDLAGMKALGTNPPNEVAIADAGVPAGEYARQALRNAGYLDALKPVLIGQKDVRSVLRAVRVGDASAGFVYATDAQAYEGSVRVAFTVDGGLHDPIEYYAALLTNSQAARDFFLYIQSDKARRELVKLGFMEP